MTFSQQLLAQRRVATFPDEAARLHKQLQKEYAERYAAYKQLAEQQAATSGNSLNEFLGRTN